MVVHKNRSYLKGCLLSIFLMVGIVFILIYNIFKVDDTQITYGTNELIRIFKEIGLPPEKVKTNGLYQTEGGGITFQVYFSKEFIENNILLKESEARKNDHLNIYVLTVDDIAYFSVKRHLLNGGLVQFLEEKMVAYNKAYWDKEKDKLRLKNNATEYFKNVQKIFENEETYDKGIVTLLYPNTKEGLEKIINFYKEALSMVMIKDRSKDRRIDDIQVKPGMENDLQQLIKRMMASIGLITD